MHAQCLTFIELQMMFHSTLSRLFFSSAPLLASALTSPLSVDTLDGGRYPSELLDPPGHDLPEHTVSPLPHTYVQEQDLPLNFRWDNVRNMSYLTKPLNQHVPGQWCGSCWAHSSMSALADRIKIDREAKGDDINLSIQFLLNCGGVVAGSCFGGSHSGAYQFVFQQGFIPYDTCLPYLACSNSSTLGFCPYVDTTCTPSNICKTCDMKLIPSPHPFSQECRAIERFPNTSVAEFGLIQYNESDNTVHKIKAEIFARGPVAAAINGKALHNFHGGGVFSDASANQTVTHAVEIYGWETDPATGRQAWLCRNSWGRSLASSASAFFILSAHDSQIFFYLRVWLGIGQYWAEMGCFRVELGKNILGIEHKVAWATPGHYTESNYPCWEDGKNCDGGPVRTRYYADPSANLYRVRQRLFDHKQQ
jgi:cathepsin X